MGQYTRKLSSVTWLTGIDMGRMKPKKLRLTPDHGWRARANHKILVLGRGALRLEYPNTWIVEATDDCVKIHDKPPPDDDCVVGVSYHHWPVIGHQLPLALLVCEALKSEERPLLRTETIVEEARIDLTLAWGEGRFTDSRVNREACSRLCIARKAEIQALISFDFWLDDLTSCHAHWNVILASLQLDQWVADPQRGPSLS